MEIRKRIRAIRKQKGVSAADVAAHVGISRPFYTLLEGGKRRLTVDYLERIARALGMSVAELYSEYPLLLHKQKGPHDGRRRHKHLKPINAHELRKRVEPLLGKHTEDFMDCYQLWIKAPGELKRKLRSAD